MFLVCTSVYHVRHCAIRRPARGLITELYDENDTLVSSRADLARVCNSFFSKLHDIPTLNERRDEICVKLWSHVPCKFSFES